jgi:branched-subunit amino acid transport protein AzlD
MARGKLAQLLQDFTSRPAFLGFSIGLVLAFVIWRLLANGHVLGLAGIPIMAVMSCVWVHRPIYKTIFVALFVGTILGLLLWKPPLP